MDGIIVNLLKYSVPSKDNVYEISRSNKTSGAASISWCNYDKLELTKAGLFEDLTLLPLRKYSQWLGEHNYLLLLETGFRRNKWRLLFEENHTAPIYYLGHDGAVCRHKFLTITSFTLEAGSRKAISLHCEKTGISCSEFLHETLESYIESSLMGAAGKQPLAYNFYGVLGSSDIVMMCLADQYIDVLHLLEELQRVYIRCEKSEHTLFSMSNTLVAAGDVLEEDSFSDLRGDVQIQLTLRSGYDNFNSFVDQLEDSLKQGRDETKIRKYTSIGEFDIVFELPANFLNPTVYTNGGLLSIKNTEFLTHVLQCNTRLLGKPGTPREKEMYELGCGHLFQDFMFVADNCLLACVEKANDAINELLESPPIPEFDYLKNALSLLHSDYLRNVASCLSSPWVSDLHYQYMALLRTIKVMGNPDNQIPRSQFIKLTQEVINSFKQSIYHVSQSNRFIYESPSSHLRNTGPYSKVLRAYYGIVKQILYVAYSLQLADKQAELVPIITIDAVPIPTSELFIQTNTYEGQLLMVISLPFEAFSNIPHYTSMLIHEVFHYVCPRDREKRNWLKALIMLSEVLSDIATDSIRRTLTDSAEKLTLESTIHDVPIILSHPIKRAALDFLFSDFDRLKSLIFNGAFGEKGRVWSTFFSEFLDFITIEDGNISADLKQLIHAFGGYLADRLHGLLEHAYHSSAHGAISMNAEQKHDWDIILTSYQHMHLNATVLSGYMVDSACAKLTSRYMENSSLNDFQFGLRDAVCDTAMISISNMKDEDYFALLLYNLKLQRNRIEPGQSILSFCVRLGSMFDYLHGDDKTLPRLEDMKNCLDAVKTCLERQYRQSEAEAAELCAGLLSMYELYINRFNVFREEFTILLHDSDPSQRAVNAKPHSEKLTKYLDIYYHTRREDEISTKTIDQLNIDMIDAFHIQDDLQELQKYLVSMQQRVIPGPAVTFDKPESFSVEKPFIPLQTRATSLKDFNYAIVNAARLLKNNDNDEHLWFRGQKKAKWKITPSIFREESKLSLYDRQNKCYEYFRAKSHSSPEVGSPQGLPDIDWLAFMQHYNVPTNLIDWSEQALTALYFALEDYLDDSKKTHQHSKDSKRAIHSPKGDAADDDDLDDAVVYVLNPKRMNAAMKCMMGHAKCKGNCFCSSSAVSKEFDNCYEVPNLSIDEISNQYESYILGRRPGRRRAGKLVGAKDTLTEDYIRRYAQTLPMAILTSQANHRIRAQSGAFTAFHLGCPEYRPDGADICDYSYTDLWSIHLAYINRCPNPRQFMYRIDIGQQQSIADWVKDMGIIKSKIYPELSNIGEDVKRIL